MNETWWVKQEQLDEGQKAVIDLPLDQSHLMVGRPGSGKTNLLLLRGSQLVRSNKPNVLILTFTRTLREFVASRGFRQSHASFLRVELAPSVTTVIRPPGGQAPVTNPVFSRRRVGNPIWRQKPAPIGFIIAIQSFIG